MRQLIDAHCLIWAVDEPSKLGAAAVAALEAANSAHRVRRTASQKTFFVLPTFLHRAKFFVDAIRDSLRSGWLIDRRMASQ